MKAILTALTVLSFLLAGCEKAEHNHNGHDHDHDHEHADDHDHGPNGHKHDQDHAAPADDVAANAGDAVKAAVAKNYAVECGCAIDKKCGNYAVVDGKHMQMTGLDIGPMPFCQETGLHADIVGKVSDGKLVVSKFDLAK